MNSYKFIKGMVDKWPTWTKNRTESYVRSEDETHDGLEGVQQQQNRE
jgi:hypothetical protein